MSAENLTAENIDADRLGELLGDAAVTVLIDFWNHGCGPCRMIEPALDALAGARAGQLAIGKINITEHPDLAALYDVRSTPTLILFRGGNVVARRSGAILAGQLAAWVDNTLA